MVRAVLEELGGPFEHVAITFRPIGLLAARSAVTSPGGTVVTCVPGVTYSGTDARAVTTTVAQAAATTTTRP